MSDISQKEFFAELELLTQNLIRDIEAKARGLCTKPSSIAERRQRVLSGDFEYFCFTYFPHHIWLDDGQTPSVFQRDFLDWYPEAITIADGWRVGFAAPRGECKSTLAVKLGPAFIAVLALLQDDNVRDVTGLPAPACFADYVIVAGAEASMPAKTLEVVKTELLNNANLALDFPEICAQGNKWKIGQFTTQQGVMFESRGADQAVRGAFHGASRPKVLFIDDVITDKEAKSPAEREARWRWLEACASYLGPPDGSLKVLMVNTLLDADDPLSRAIKSPGYVVRIYKAIIDMPVDEAGWNKVAELMINDDQKAALAAAPRTLRKEDKPSYQYYLKHKKRLEKGAQTSWPSVRSLYDLMVLRISNKREFDREMQHSPRSDEEKVFANFTIWVNRLPDFVPFGACDPSMGKSKKADPSAILVGFRSKSTSVLHVEAESRKQRAPSVLLRDICRFQREYNCVKWAFENNVAFDHMRKTFMDDGPRLHNVELPLVGVTATIAQAERIEALEPFVSDNPARIQFSRETPLLQAELEQFPNPEGHHHFDLSCTLSLLQMISLMSLGMPKVHSINRYQR